MASGIQCPSGSALTIRSSQGSVYAPRLLLILIYCRHTQQGMPPTMVPEQETTFQWLLPPALGACGIQQRHPSLCTGSAFLVLCTDTPATGLHSLAPRTALPNSVPLLLCMEGFVGTVVCAIFINETNIPPVNSMPYDPRLNGIISPSTPVCRQLQTGGQERGGRKE